MSEEPTTLSPENMQTIVAVSFVLALLALALDFYNFNRTNTIAVVAAVNNQLAVDLDAKILRVEDRLRALERAAKAAPAPTPAAEEAPVDADVAATQ